MKWKHRFNICYFKKRKKKQQYLLYLPLDIYYLFITICPLTDICHYCPSCLLLKTKQKKESECSFFISLEKKKKTLKNEQNRRNKIQLFIRSHINWRYVFSCHRKGKIHTKERCIFLRYLNSFQLGATDMCTSITLSIEKWEDMK